MKKITLLFALILGFGALSKAQNCNFTYTQDPGSNTVNFQAPSGFSGILYSFIWQFSNSNSYMFGSSVSQTYNQSTTETVTLDIYGADSTIICSSTQTIQISVSAPPPCSFTFNQSSGGIFVFALSQTGSNLQVTWSFGDGTSGTGSIVEHNYLNNGVYMVTMTVVAGGDTCTSTMAVNVSNNNPNDSTACSFDYYANVNGIDTYLSFYTTGGNQSISYTWNFGDGTTGTGSQLVHQFPNAGTYTVCLTAGANGALVCENCMDIVVGVNNLADCAANFTYSSSELTAFFINQSNNSYLNTDVNYTWNFGDGAFSDSPFPYHTYNQAGNYNVCLTVSEGNCADTICQMISVPNSIVNPIDSCSAYFVISQQNPFSVDVVNMSNGSSYVWTIAGISNTNVFPIITVPFIGSYLLCLTVTNPNGCVATYCDSLTIDSTGIVQRNTQSEFTINVVSPAQITGFSATSIKTIVATNNEIFPNPFSNSFTINNPNSEKVNYEVYSIDGKIVKQGLVTNKIETINAENLTSGLYLLSLVNSNGERRVIKINKN